MVNKYEKYLEGGPAAPSKYEQFVPKPTPQQIVDEAPGRNTDDPMWLKAARKADDFVRAGANAMTFGLADRFASTMGEENTDLRTAEGWEQSPYISMGGAIAGSMLPAAGLSRGVGAATGMTRNTYGNIAAREGMAGGLFTAIDDAVRKQEFNPGDIATSAGIAGVAAPIVTFASRAISPEAKVRATGTLLDDTDKANMHDLMGRANDRGVRLSIPELADEVAPSRAGDIQSRWNNATTFDSGAVAARNFDEGRAPGILAAGRNMVNQIGPGIEPLPVQKAAKSAIKGRVSDLTEQNAAPLYKAAEGTKVPRMKPKPAGVKEAERALARDTVKSEAIASAQGRPGKPPLRSDINWYDRVKKQLDVAIGAAEKAGDTYRLELLQGTKKNLLNILDNADPRYGQARQAAEQALAEGDRLRTGPLGMMANTDNSRAQGAALFGATNATEQGMAGEAIGMLPQGMPRRILGNTVDSAVSQADIDFARRVLPTPQAKDLARMAMGSDYPLIENTLDATRAVRPMGGAPNANAIAQHSGPLQTIFTGIRNIRQGEVIDKFLDPDSIGKLGRVGPVQQGFLSGTTATGATADPFSTEEEDRKRAAEKARKKRKPKKDRDDLFGGGGW